MLMDGMEVLMSIKSKVQPVVDKFVKENPGAKKIKYTGEDRTAEKELGFICQRPKQYPLIEGEFKKKFKADIPALNELKTDQKKWCLDFIADRAGKAGAYAHVGGKAQDLWVDDLTTDERTKLRDMLVKAGFKIIYEKVSGAKSDYHAKLESTNVFHVYVE